MAESFTDAPIRAKGEPRAVYQEPLEDSFKEGDFASTPIGAGKQETINDNGSRDRRKYGDSVLERIAAIEKREAGETIEDKPAEAVTAAAPTEDAGQATTPTSPKSAETAPTEPPPPSPDAEALKAERDRYAKANEELVAELEALRKDKPKPTKQPNKYVVEAEEAYVEDQLTAIRKLIAAAHGIDDLADKRIDDEIRDLYTDLTAHVVGVKPEESHLAKREAARARQLLAREKRERKAEETTAAERAEADAEAKKAESAATFIGNRLSQPQSDGKVLRDQFPLLHKFAKRLDGMSPEALIWRTIQQETKTGKLSAKDDDGLIAEAAKLVEAHYHALADEFGKAQPVPTQPSTAQPSQPTTTSARPEQRQQTAARTLTSADASVAPATPPAPKTETPKDKPPSFKNKKAHQEWALRHIPK